MAPCYQPLQILSPQKNGFAVILPSDVKNAISFFVQKANGYISIN